MKKVIYSQYGGPEVLQVVESAKPTPRAGEVLVAVKAVAVTAADIRIRAARFPKGFAPIARLVFGVYRPRKQVLGMIFSGVVESIGNGVSEFTVGDEVCGSTGGRLGAYAEYIIVTPKQSIVKKPIGVSHTDAVAVLFGGTAALYFIRDRAKVRSGEKVAVNGATGAVGLAAVQLAVAFGAQVTAVVRRDATAVMEELGVGSILDVRQLPLNRSTSQFDVVIDTVGNLSIEDDRHLLTPTGRLVLMVASLGQMIRGGRQVITGVATEHKVDISYILSLLESGVLKAVISAKFPLSSIVAAHTHAEAPERIGVVVMTAS